MQNITPCSLNVNRMEENHDDSVTLDTSDRRNSGGKGTRGGTLTQVQHKLFVRYLQTKIKPSKSELKEADLLDSPMLWKQSHNGVSSRFKSWAKKMALRASDNALVFKKTGKEILYREQFDEVIRGLNKSTSGLHLSLTVTLKKLREKYTMGKRQFGMSEDTAREILFTCVSPECPCKKVKKLSTEEDVPKPTTSSTSCNPLADCGSTTPKTSPGDSKGNLQEVTSSGQKNLTEKSKVKSKPPVAYYALLDISAIANLHAKSVSKNGEGTDTAGVNVRPVSDDTNGPAKTGLSPPTKASPFSLLRPRITPSIASSAILKQLALQKSAVSSSRPNPNSLQRSILCRIVPNQNGTASVQAHTISSMLPNAVVPCVSRKLFDANSAAVNQDPLRTTLGQPGTPLNTDLLESLNPFSIFGDSPQPTRGPSAIFGTYDANRTPDSTTAVNKKSKKHKKSAIPSFNAPCENLLPYQDLWFYQKDIQNETNRFRKLVHVIQDMKIDVRQSLMGLKPAAERLRKKILVAENLLGRCKEISAARKKLVSEKKKAKKLASSKSRAAEDNVVKTQTTETQAKEGS